MVLQTEVFVSTKPKQLNLITSQISEVMANWDLPRSGLLNIFIHHTSASLVIQENADPTARQDLEQFFDRLVPENQSWMRHTLEGPDDSPSHMRSTLTQTSLNIPIVGGQLGLGTWQGIYLFEHRSRSHNRTLTLTVTG